MDDGYAGWGFMTGPAYTSTSGVIAVMASQLPQDGYAIDAGSIRRSSGMGKYEDRDIEALGDDYTEHVAAMTKEE